MSRSMHIEDKLENGYELEVLGEFEKEHVREVERYEICRGYDDKPMKFEDLERVFSSTLSTEYTKLIQVAGRFCEYYASDILDYIKALENDLSNPIKFLDGQRDKKKNYLFGFRKGGVDRESFMISRIKNYGMQVFHYYRAVYEIEVHMFIEDDGRYLIIEVGFERID